METYTDEQISFQLILHSGNARGNIIQSIRAYKDGRTDESDSFLTKAEEELGKAHDIHFQMIQKKPAAPKRMSLCFLCMLKIT